MACGEYLQLVELPAELLVDGNERQQEAVTQILLLAVQLQRRADKRPREVVKFDLCRQAQRERL